MLGLLRSYTIVCAGNLPMRVICPCATNLLISLVLNHLEEFWFYTQKILTILFLNNQAVSFYPWAKYPQRHNKKCWPNIFKNLKSLNLDVLFQSSWHKSKQFVLLNVTTLSYTQWDIHKNQNRPKIGKSEAEIQWVGKLPDPTV